MTATNTFWTTVGIVALATVAVSVANLAFLYLNARETRKHERRMARDALNQRRLEETYVELVTFMHRMGVWSEHNVSPLPGSPDAVTDREVSEVVGRVKTFASDEVIEQVERWTDFVREGITAMQARDRANQVKASKDLRAQEKVVREAVRRELSSKE